MLVRGAQSANRTKKSDRDLVTESVYLSENLHWPLLHPPAALGRQLSAHRMPDGVALLPARPRGRIYEAARMLNASARFKAHAGEYLRGLPPQVGCADAIQARRCELLHSC